MTMPAVGLAWGEGRGASVARSWITSLVASDDAVPWGLSVETNDTSPAGLGGECAYTMAFLTVRAAAGTILKITPILNDIDEQSQSIDGTSTLIVRQPTITIPQQAGSPTPMRVQTFEVPLWTNHVRDGKTVAIFHPRGERCRIRVESVGPIGTGAFRLEQCEVEYEVIRRSTFAAFSA